METKKIKHIATCFFIFTWCLVLFACQPNYTPKPYGYQRIKFPEKTYLLSNDTFPYLFEYPSYSKIIPYTRTGHKKGWINIVFPEYNGTIHLTYHPLENNLPQHLEDARNLAYKHVVKADAIPEIPFHYEEKNVHGIIYDIKGNTATSVIFYATDSLNHFVYGSLYFNTKPNQDSLAPVIQFFRKDIVHLVETLQWN
jgi:gliding motility-associated lipoprotein GldD